MTPRQLERKANHASRRRRIAQETADEAAATASATGAPATRFAEDAIVLVRAPAAREDMESTPTAGAVQRYTGASALYHREGRRWWSGRVAVRCGSTILVVFDTREDDGHRAARVFDLATGAGVFAHVSALLAQRKLYGYPAAATVAEDRTAAAVRSVAAAPCTAGRGAARGISSDLAATRTRATVLLMAVAIAESDPDAAAGDPAAPHYAAALAAAVHRAGAVEIVADAVLYVLGCPLLNPPPSERPLKRRSGSASTVTARAWHRRAVTATFGVLRAMAKTTHDGPVPTTAAAAAATAAARDAAAQCLGGVLLRVAEAMSAARQRVAALRGALRSAFR